MFHWHCYFTKGGEMNKRIAILIAVLAIAVLVAALLAFAIPCPGGVKEYLGQNLVALLSLL